MIRVICWFFHCEKDVLYIDLLTNERVIQRAGNSWFTMQMLCGAHVNF